MKDEAVTLLVLIRMRFAPSVRDSILKERMQDIGPAVAISKTVRAKNTPENYLTQTDILERLSLYYDVYETTCTAVTIAP